MRKGKFIISLDFELHWGGIELWELESTKEYFLKTREFIPELLKLFEENNIEATWATVGFLFAQNKTQLSALTPKLQPFYKRKELSAYSLFPSIGCDESSDPFHFAPSLIDLIMKTPGQELASHTFSHYYCNEPGQTAEQFDADLKAAQEIAQINYGITLKSLVFPRNQFNPVYLEIAYKNGIRVVRSNPDVWFWSNDYGKISSLLRAIDTLIPISRSLTYRKVKTEKKVVLLPASRFFRSFKSKEQKIQKIKIKRIKREMTHAAKRNENYHLWWHPHNMADDIKQNKAQLEEIIAHFKILNTKYSFMSTNMIGFVNEEQ